MQVPSAPIRPYVPTPSRPVPVLEYPVAAANSQRGPTGSAGSEPLSFIAELPGVDGAEKARRLQESAAVQMLVDVGATKRSVQNKAANI